MALIRCPDCGTKVSTSASACIKCGRPLTQQDRESTTNYVSGKMVIATFAGLIAFIVYKANHPSDDPVRSGQVTTPSSPAKTPEEKERDERLTRAVMGARSIKAALRDPPSFELTQVLAIDKTGAVCYMYRAKNGFGGYNREMAVLEKGASGLRSTGMKGFESTWNRACGSKSGDDLTTSVRIFL